MTTRSGGPTPESERIAGQDVLRGVAVLGILPVNLQSFAMVEAARMLPNLDGPLTGARAGPLLARRPRPECDVVVRHMPNCRRMQFECSYPIGCDGSGATACR